MEMQDIWWSREEKEKKKKKKKKKSEKIKRRKKKEKMSIGNRNSSLPGRNTSWDLEKRNRRQPQKEFLSRFSFKKYIYK